jgi:hypothetical protein
MYKGISKKKTPTPEENLKLSSRWELVGLNGIYYDTVKFCCKNRSYSV